MKGDSSTNEDTLKTIKSNFEKTSNSQTLGTSFKTDTLGYSVTGEGMSPKDLMKMRK